MELTLPVMTSVRCAMARSGVGQSGAMPSQNISPVAAPPASQTRFLICNLQHIKGVGRACRRMRLCTRCFLSSSCNWVCKCWCQRLATLRNLGPPREWLRHILSPDQELMKSILLNCRGQTIRVADVRAASISKERCCQQRFRTVMDIAQESGFGK